MALRFAVAGGPSIFKPADLMMTSSTDDGASNTVVLMSSGSLVFDCGNSGLTFGGAPGVTGDESKAGVRAGEWERVGTSGEPGMLGGDCSKFRRELVGRYGGIRGGNKNVFSNGGGRSSGAGALCEVCSRAVVGLCSAAKSTTAELLLEPLFRLTSHP